MPMMQKIRYIPVQLSSHNYQQLGLMILKALNGWIDKIFKKFLQLLKEMLPKSNKIPYRNYEEKNTLSDGYGLSKDSFMS